ncbi:unnamed protein product [Amaranthus hypochondriacus]
MASSRIFSRNLITRTKLKSSPSQFLIPMNPFKNPNLSSPISLINLYLRPLHLGTPISRFCYTSIHGSCIDTAENDYSPTKEAEIICKLLSKLPKHSSIDSVLDSSGVKELTPMLVLEVLKQLSNSGILAFSFFSWAEKQKGFEYTTESYNALIDSLGKIKQFKMIWVLIDSMKSKGLLTKYTFNLIIRRYARAKRVEDAINTFEGMKQYGMKIDSSDLNKFLDTMCKSRQVKDAHKMFDEMKKRGFKPDQKSYTILIEGYGQQQNLVKVNEVYSEMKDEGFELDVVAYGIIMNAYCRVGKIDRAVEMFSEMEEKGVKPSPHIFCILINGLGSYKRLGEALKYFEMSKASGCVTESPTYNAVVGSYCWSLRFDDAFRIMDEMRRFRVGPNSRTYDIILNHLIKAGRGEEAYSVFQKMGNDQGCDPTVSTFEIIIRMFCSKGELNMAVRVWDEMKAKGIIPGMPMFASMINSFRHVNQLEDACNYLEEMIDLGIRPPGLVFSSLKQALIDNGKKDTAQILLRKIDAMKLAPISG